MGENFLYFVVSLGSEKKEHKFLPPFNSDVLSFCCCLNSIKTIFICLMQLNTCTFHYC